MLRWVMAMLVALAPFIGADRAPSSSTGGPGTDTNDEWKCDGNTSDHCNPQSR